MRRITLSVDDALADSFDDFVQQNNYQSRSEAFRDLLRNTTRNDDINSGSAKYCVGTLSYIYNHHERQLASRLTQMQHDHHDVMVSTMHAHLDHDNCIETVILRGPMAAVSAFAQAVISQTGVRHGKFHSIPVEVDQPSSRRHSHLHIHPRS